MAPLSCTTAVTTTQSESTTNNGSVMGLHTDDHIDDPCDKVEEERPEIGKVPNSDTSAPPTEEEVPLQIVWRNVLLFAILHIASLYSVYLMFTTAKWQTNAFGELFIVYSYLLLFLPQNKKKKKNKKKI